MHARSSSPTKFPLPQFRLKRITIAGLGFLLASCSENLTQPGDHPATPPAAADRRPTPDIVIMERTTTAAARNGETPVAQSRRQVLNPLLRIRGGMLDTRIPSKPQPVALEELPLPPIALPARPEAAICADLPMWTESIKAAGGRDVESTGYGDAPASSVTLPQADGSTWHVQRTWTRTANTWQLDRQVTTGANGYKDVVTYRHQTAAGKIANNAIATTTCSAHVRLTGLPSSDVSKSLYAPHAGALNAILFPNSGVLGEFCGVSDDCYYKQMSVYKDDIAIVVAATAVAIACSPPAIILAGPCIAATTAYLAAVAALYVDQRAVQHCIEEAAKTPVALVSPGAPFSKTADGPGGYARASVTVAGAGHALGDCGGGSGAGQGLTCRWDVWQISYDGGETWEYFGTFMVCDNAS